MLGSGLALHHILVWINDTCCWLCRFIYLQLRWQLGSTIDKYLCFTKTIEFHKLLKHSERGWRDSVDIFVSHSYYDSNFIRKQSFLSTNSFWWRNLRKIPNHEGWLRNFSNGWGLRKYKLQWSFDNSRNLINPKEPPRSWKPPTRNSNIVTRSI